MCVGGGGGRNRGKTHVNHVESWLLLLEEQSEGSSEMSIYVIYVKYKMRYTSTTFDKISRSILYNKLFINSNAKGLMCGLEPFKLKF